MKSKLVTGAVLALAVSAGGITDLTFFAVSDPHFGQHSANRDNNRAAMPHFLNTLAGSNYPASVGGGVVAEPRGIVVPGDLINMPDTALWRQYALDYDIAGEGRVKHPVFDGLGNHDYSGAGGVIVDSMRARNARRRGLTDIDSANLHYSWDWDGVHFVQLNLYSGTVAKDSDPFGSYGFLERDLDRHVGNSGRPVMLVQHYPFPDTGWWPESEASRTAALLKRYNCIGILHGHSHAKRFYKYEGLDVYDDGSIMNGDILVFRITEGRMFVLHRSGPDWGTIVHRKDISMGGTGIPAGPKAGREFTLLVEGVGRLFAGNRKVHRVDILSFAGRSIRNLDVSSTAMTWDRMDNRGRPVPPGLYLFRLRTDDGTVNLKAALR
jgi:hypothetical protein